MAAKVQRNRGRSYAAALAERMETSRVGVMEVARASGLNKETISRLLSGQTRQPTTVTQRKLDAGFERLDAEASAATVVVTVEEFDELRQRVELARNVGLSNAGAIDEAHVKLDRLELAVAAVAQAVSDLRRDLIERPGAVFGTSP